MVHVTQVFDRRPVDLAPPWQVVDHSGDDVYRAGGCARVARRGEEEWQRHSARVRNEARREAAARDYLISSVASH